MPLGLGAHTDDHLQIDQMREVGQAGLGCGGEPEQGQGRDETSAAIADELAVAATPEMVPYE